MVEVVCVDGCVLGIAPVPRLDRSGAPFEVTLRLTADGEPFGEVGECSGWLLARAARQLRQAQAAGGPDAFPRPAVEVLLAADGQLPAGPRSVLRRSSPRDHELLSLRARDPDDGEPSGELRLWVRQDRSWVAGPPGSRGRWSTRSRAVLDAWGGSGRGVRGLLDGPALLVLLDAVVAEGASVLDSTRPGEPAGPGPDRLQHTARTADRRV